MHTLEMQVNDANRREEAMKTEVERHRLRVESKVYTNNNLIGLQKHIDSLKYGSSASLHASASSYEAQDLRTENEKLRRHLQAYENQIKDLESELS